MSADELRARMLSLFARELERRAERVEELVRELADGPGAERQRSLVDSLSLEAHNLIGTARTLGLDEAELVAVGLESLALRIGRGETALGHRDAATVAGALRSLAASYADEARTAAAPADG